MVDEEQEGATFSSTVPIDSEEEIGKSFSFRDFLIEDYKERTYHIWQQIANITRRALVRRT